MTRPYKNVERSRASLANAIRVLSSWYLSLTELESEPESGSESESELSLRSLRSFSVVSKNVWRTMIAVEPIKPRQSERRWSASKEVNLL